MSLLSVNNIPAVSVRKVTPMIGAWFADADLDLADNDRVPSGRVSLTIGDSVLSGTVDPRFSGRLGPKATVRIVAGAGGWDKPVRAQHFHNDASVRLSAVVAATAAEVGEALLSKSDSALGVDFVRTSGPASRVLSGTPWYVNNAGVTVLGARTNVAASKDAVVLSWDPCGQQAIVVHDDLVEPGWLITDERFGSVTASDVEQVWNHEGSRATVWCSSAGQSRLSGTLASMVREFAGVATLKTYGYAVFGMDGDKVQLQADTKTHPDLLPAPIWFGVPGVSAKLTPASNVRVRFVEGDPAKPEIVAFDDTPPVELNFEAVTKATVKAATVELGAAAPTGVATLQSLTALLGLLAAQNAALVLWLNDPTLIGTFAPSAATLAPLLTALGLTTTKLGLIPSNFSLTVKAAL